MKFYSYQYLLSQIVAFDWIQWVAGVLILAFLVYTVIEYYRHKKDSKYRELVILAVIGVLLLACIKVSEFQESQDVGNKHVAAVQFVESLADKLAVDKNEVYINTTLQVTSAIIKVKDDFYRVIVSDEPNHFLFEKLQIHNPKVELVEVQK